jgi:hypothetical protein
VGAEIAQSVRLATGWTIEGSKFESRQGQEFSLFHVIKTGPGAQPFTYPKGIGGTIPGGVKRQGREADHSPPTNCRGQDNVDL